MRAVRQNASVVRTLFDLFSGFWARHNIEPDILGGTCPPPPLPHQILPWIQICQRSVEPESEPHKKMTDQWLKKSDFMPPLFFSEYFLHQCRLWQITKLWAWPWKGFFFCWGFRLSIFPFLLLPNLSFFFRHFIFSGYFSSKVFPSGIGIRWWVRIHW